jgi:hypothetical protein
MENGTALLDRAVGALPRREAEHLLQVLAASGAAIRLDKLATLAASISPDMVPNGLTQLITAKIQKIYAAYSDEWRKIVTRGRTDYMDTQTIEIVESLGMADELKKTGGEFNIKHIPDATAASYAVYGFGNLFEVDMRTLRSDRLGYFHDLSVRIANSMISRFHNIVFVDYLQSDPTIYDGNTLFDATNHGNDLDDAGAGVALSYPNARDAIALGDAFADANGEKVGADKYWLVCGYENWEPSEQLMGDPDKPDTGNRNINAIRKRVLGAILSRKLGWDWYFIANPTQMPGLHIDFFEGKEDPQITMEKKDSSYQFVRPGLQRWRSDLWLAPVWKSKYAAIRGSTNNEPS